MGYRGVYGALHNHALPGDWQPRLADSGVLFFISESREETTWEDPRCPLPAGWVERKDDSGVSFFVHEQSGKASEHDPRPAALVPYLCLNDETMPGGFSVHRTEDGFVYFQQDDRHTRLWTDPRAPLPNAWKENKDANHVSYFVKPGSASDSIAQITTYHDPRLHVVESPLPPDWVEEVDATGRILFRNTSTNKTTVTDPRDGALPPGWTMLKAENGLVLFTDPKGNQGTKDPRKRIRAKPKQDISWKTKYAFVADLEKGGYGHIFTVKDKATGTVWAAKKIKWKDVATRKTVLGEVAVHAGLESPHIVRLRESFRSDATKSVVIIMELCGHGTLRHVVASRNMELRSKKTSKERRDVYIPEDHVMFWFARVAKAVQYLHSREILHLDVKADNVFLTDDLDVRLGDFGLARRAKDNTPIRRDEFQGTPEWVCPETFAGKIPTAAADVWGLGVLLYFLCALQMPFARSTRADYFNKLQNDVMRTSPKPIPDHYSSEMKTLVASLLRKKPKLRPSIDAVLALPYVKKYVGDIGKSAADADSD